MYRRNLTGCIQAALADTPVVLINGARQTGKSTLAQWIVSSGHPARYLTLDDVGLLSAARDDPAGFLAGLGGPVVLDEVQRAPELFRAMKLVVDRERTPGRFLLTGSADVFLLPRLSESLAGRMEIITLWPLSQGEVEGVVEGFVDAVFGGTLPTPASMGGVERPDLIRRVLGGGYPEALARTSHQRRQAWYASYATTIVQRDIRDLAQIEGLTAMPRLLSLLAARSTSLLNTAELSRAVGLPQTTLKRYMDLLEATFLVQSLPAWSGNLSKRLVKAPRPMLNDSGLMGHLTGLTEERVGSEPHLFGAALHNFVAMELRKQAGWSTARPQMYHYRTHSQEEVDILLEDATGAVVGVEVKSGATVGSDDFRGLRRLSEALGDRFRRGVVLYAGSECVPFGPRLHALPVSALWRLNSRPQ